MAKQTFSLEVEIDVDALGRQISKEIDRCFGEELYLGGAFTNPILMEILKPLHAEITAELTKENSAFKTKMLKQLFEAM